MYVVTAKKWERQQDGSLKCVALKGIRTRSSDKRDDFEQRMVDAGWDVDTTEE